MEDVARRVHPDDWAGVEAALQAAIRPGGRGAYDEEFRFAHPDRSLRWVVSHGPVALDSEGGTRPPARLFGTVLDITDRKEAEMRIRESEGRFRQMADAMPQIVWMSRPDQSVAYFNGRWFRYTGQSEAQAYGPGGWGEAIHPEDLDRIVEAAARTFATGEPFEAEYRIRGSDGVYRWHLGRGV